MVKKMFKFLIAFAMVVQLVPSSYVNINAIASNEVQPSEYAELITSNEPDERVALGAANSEGSAKLNVTTLLDGVTVQEETLVYNGDNQPGVATATASAGYTIASITLDGINYAGSSILFDRELGILEKSLVINVIKIAEPVQEPVAVVEEPVVEEPTEPVQDPTTDPVEEPVQDPTTDPVEDPVEETNNDLQNTTPNVKQATPANKWLGHEVTIYSYIGNETYPFAIENEDVSINSKVKIEDLDIEDSVTRNKQTYVIDYITYNDVVVEDQFYIGWIIGDVKVYYTAKPTTTEYTITFNANGGKFEHGDTTREVTTKNGRAYLSEEPTRNGYEFVGWYTKKGSGSQWGEKVTDTRRFTEDTLVHARWEKKESQIQDKRVQFYILKQGEEKPVGTTPDATYKYLPLGSGVLADNVKDVYGEEEVKNMILSKPANKTLTANSYCKVNTECKELAADEYEIVWYRIIYDASDGWHVDGYIKEAAKVNIIYNLVQPGEDSYSFFGSKSIDVGSSIDAWPTNTLPERKENGVTYKFSGWYTDIKRTTKADLSTIYGEEYRNQIVKLYAAYETTTRVGLEVVDGNYVYDGTAKGLESVEASVTGSTILYSKDEGKTWTEKAPTFTEKGLHNVKVKATHANYVDSEEVPAQVNITARPVTITVNGASKSYDGQPLLNPKTITSEPMGEGRGLVEGQVVNATFTGPESRTNAGTDELGLDKNNLTITVDGNTENLSGNYVITVVPGILEVTKAEAIGNELTVGNTTLVYNGLSQTAFKATAKEGTVEYSLNEQNWTTEVPTRTDVGNTLIHVRVVSENYKTATATETLEITPRPIKVTSGNATKVYDGTALVEEKLSYDKQSEDNPNAGLVDGQTFTGKATGSITNVLDSKEGNNSIDTIKIMDGKNDVTNNYTWKEEKELGTLTITARAVTVKAADATATYVEGIKLTNPTCAEVTTTEKNQGLLKGHKVSATEMNSVATEVGNTDNVLEAKFVQIKDSSTNDVTSNYAITAVNGVLTIVEGADSELAVDGTDVEKVYDGTSHSAGIPTMKEDSLKGTIYYTLTPDNESSWSTTLPTRNEVDEYIVNIKVVKAGYANYYTTETLKITARPVTITVNGASKSYDGQPLLNPKTITSEPMGEGKGLVEGQVVNATFTGPESRTNAGTDELGLDENNLTITVDGNTENLSGNYDITVVPGKLEVTKAEAIGNELTVGNTTLVYNGLSQTAFKATAKEGTVEYSLDEQNWKTEVPTRTDVGNTLIHVRVVSENYKTATATETLEITPRPIKVTSGNATKVYDGTALTNTVVTIDQQSDENPDGGLVSGHTFIGQAIGSITNVEDSEDNNNTIGAIEIMDGENDVTNNYTWEEELGTLTITARPVTITVDSASKSYDGQPLLNPGSVTAEAMSEGKGLVEGQVINATVTGPESRTNVGSDDLGLDENNLTITVDGNTEDLSGNYDITVVQGILEVTKAGAAENAVTVKDVSVVFDRNTHTAYVPTDAKEGSTIYYSSDEEDWIKEVPEFFDAGTTTVYIKVVNDNYADFTTNEKVEIIKRPVTITANSGNKMYDGTPLTNNGYTVEKANEDNPNIGLLEYDELSVTVKGSQTIPGESANEITDYAITNDGESMNANYDVTTISGTLTVTLAELGLEPMDNVNEIYDGTGKTIGNVVASEEGSTIWYSTSKGRDAWTTEKPTFTEAGDHEVYVKAIKEHYYDAMFDNPVIVTIVPKEITITALDARQEFNGSPLTSAAYSISENGLVEGQSIREILFEGTQTVVGESSNSILKVSISDGNEDKSMNYKMTFVDGRLIVTDAPVPVTPAAPATPDTPTPPVGPVVPTTTTPTTITPTPTAPLPVLTPTLPQENVTENETPLAIPEEEEKVEIKENVTPKAVMGSWALFNLLFAAGSLILGVWLLVSRLHKEEENEENEDDDNSIPYKRKKWLRVATTITAIVSVLVFCLTEDITLKMMFFDKWSLLMAVFFVAQFVFFFFGKKWKEEKDEENDSADA